VEANPVAWERLSAKLLEAAQEVAQEHVQEATQEDVLAEGTPIVATGEAAVAAVAPVIAQAAIVEAEDVIDDNDLIRACTEGDLQQLRQWRQQGIRVTAHQFYVTAGLGVLGYTKCLVTELGANINGVDVDGRTALSLAAEEGRLDVVSFLIKEHGAEIDHKDAIGRTPILLAAQGGFADLVRVLAMEFGADVNEADDYGCTPLWMAYDDISVARILVLEAEADMNKGDNDGFTPLIRACVEGNGAVVTLLIENGAEIEKGMDGLTALLGSLLGALLGPCCSCRYVDIATLLIDKGADVTKVADEGMTALMLSCLLGHLKLSVLIIDHGADIHSTAKDISFATSLHVAANAGHDKIVELLLEKGALIDQTNALGWNALHFAACEGKHGIIELLLDKGADARHVTNAGLTALDYARDKWGVDDSIRLLEAAIGEHSEVAAAGDVAKGGSGVAPERLLLAARKEAEDLGQAVAQQDAEAKALKGRMRGMESMLAENQRQAQATQDQQEQKQVALEMTLTRERR
jgi:ankyrin repeat protein